MNQAKQQKVSSLKNVHELIDISSSEDEEGTPECASTPLPREIIPSYRVILQVSHSSAEATPDEEECFDISTDSLESSCKKLRLNSSLESIELETYAPRQNPTERQNEDLPDSPGSPDKSMCSDLFVVEKSPDKAESITSSRVAENHEMVQQEDSASYFITPPGTPRKISFNPASPLNDLEEKRSIGGSEDLGTRLPPLTFMPRQPGRSAFTRGVALSQPAPGLDSHCKRVGIGTGHGCSLRFPRWYFGY